MSVALVPDGRASYSSLNERRSACLPACLPACLSVRKLTHVVMLTSVISAKIFDTYGMKRMCRSVGRRASNFGENSCADFYSLPCSAPDYRPDMEKRAEWPARGRAAVSPFPGDNLEPSRVHF